MMHVWQNTWPHGRATGCESWSRHTGHISGKVFGGCLLGVVTGCVCVGGGWCTAVSIGVTRFWLDGAVLADAR